jgi:Tfp pilus assembly protein PilF
MKQFSLALLTIIFLMSCRNKSSSNSLAVKDKNQKLNYQQWKEEAKTEIRLLPEYGHAVKSTEQKQADLNLIEAYTKQEGSRLKGSEVLVKLGFDYISKGDLRTAMYRFNQAWLLDPKNENVYWGFASIYFTFKDYQTSMLQLDNALAINPRNANILTDKATIFSTLYYKSNDATTLLRAKEFFTQAYKIDPRNKNMLFKFSAFYFDQNDCQNALKYYKEYTALGGEPISKEYASALTNRCKE